MLQYHCIFILFRACISLLFYAKFAFEWLLPRMTPQYICWVHAFMNRGKKLKKKDSNFKYSLQHLLWGLSVTSLLILSFSPGTILCLHTFSINVKKETCPWSWFCWNLKILSCLKFCNRRLCPVMLIYGVRRFSKSEAWKFQTFEIQIKSFVFQRLPFLLCLSRKY